MSTYSSNILFLNSKEKSKSKSTVSNSEIQNIKKFLIEEYGVNEKCLEIN